jgi:hypothetical protein
VTHAHFIGYRVDGGWIWNRGALLEMHGALAHGRTARANRRQPPIYERRNDRRIWLNRRWLRRRVCCPISPAVASARQGAAANTAHELDNGRNATREPQKPGTMASLTTGRCCRAGAGHRGGSPAKPIDGRAACPAWCEPGHFRSCSSIHRSICAAVMVRRPDW